MRKKHNANGRHPLEEVTAAILKLKDLNLSSLITVADIDLIQTMCADDDDINRDTSVEDEAQWADDEKY